MGLEAVLPGPQNAFMLCYVMLCKKLMDVEKQAESKVNASNAGMKTPVLVIL